MKSWNEKISISCYLYIIEAIWHWMGFLHIYSVWDSYIMKHIFLRWHSEYISLVSSSLNFDLDLSKRLPEYLNCSLWCLRCNLIQKLNVTEYKKYVSEFVKDSSKFYVHASTVPWSVFLRMVPKGYPGQDFKNKKYFIGAP